MRSKLMKIVTIGLFAVAMLLNVSVYFDANDSQNADISLGSLKVSLFQKAYAESSAECGDCSCETQEAGANCECTAGGLTGWLFGCKCVCD